MKKLLRTRVIIGTVGMGLLVLLSLLVVFFNILDSQDHCWSVGDQMAEGKPETIVISGDEAKRLFGEDIDISASGTAEVGTAAYYHFKCH